MRKNQTIARARRTAKVAPNGRGPLDPVTGAPTRPEGAGIERVHRRDVGGARQEHVDLDQVAEGAAGLVQHALDVGDDVPKLRLEGLGQFALFIEAGNTGDVEQVGGRRGKGQRRRLDAGRGREVLYGHVSALVT